MKPENKMTEVERRIRVALLEQRKTRGQLATEVGIKASTLGNIIRGARCSDKTRQKITVALKTRIWRHIPAPIFFSPGGALVFSHLTAAREFQQLLSNFAVLEGRTVKFVKPCTLMLSRESETI